MNKIDTLINFKDNSTEREKMSENRHSAILKRQQHKERENE